MALILGDFWQIDLDRFLKKGALASALLAFLIILAGLLAALSLETLSQETQASFAKPPSPLAGRSAYYEKIASGALALRRSSSSQLSSVVQELLVLGRNLRPDSKGKLAAALFGLKHSSERRPVKFQETLFLSLVEAEEGSSLSFSSSPTGVWIKPLKATKTELIVEIGKKTDAGEEKERMALKVHSVQAACDLPCFQALKGAKWWGRDLLIQKYGGDPWRSFKQKEKLEWGGGVAFVAAGEYLTWEDGQWKVVSLDKALPNAPLAHIRAVGGKNMEIDVWDETGFHHLELKIALEPAPKLQFNLEQMPSALRLRTASQVSCLIGKRRVMMREGDWLLKTSSGWRNLKKLEEIEAVLDYKLRGQLLIFDRLERQDGGVFFKGHLFDEMRTQATPFSLPIAEKKKRVKKEIAAKEKKG